MDMFVSQGLCGEGVIRCPMVWEESDVALMECVEFCAALSYSGLKYEAEHSLGLLFTQTPL